MVQFANLDRQNGWPEGIIASLIQQESGGRYNAVSSAGARGYAQFMPRTRDYMIQRYHVDPWSHDINEAARAASLYLREQYDRFGNIEQALAAYNAGPGNVQRAIRSGGNWLSHLRQETRNYVPQIMGRLGTNLQFYQRALAYNNAGVHTQEENEYEAEQRRGRLSALGIDEVTNPVTGERMRVEDMGLTQLLGVVLLSIFANAAHRAPNVQPDALRPHVPAPYDGPENAAPQVSTNVMPRLPVASADRGESLTSPQTPPVTAALRTPHDLVARV